MKVKMNILTLEDKITELINRSKSKYAQEQGVAISVGIDILNSYLISIGERAIKIDDPIIMCDLLDLGIITPGSEEEERATRERAKELRQ